MCTDSLFPQKEEKMNFFYSDKNDYNVILVVLNLETRAVKVSECICLNFLLTSNSAMYSFNI